MRQLQRDRRNRLIRADPQTKCARADRIARGRIDQTRASLASNVSVTLSAAASYDDRRRAEDQVVRVAHRLGREYQLVERTILGVRHVQIVVVEVHVDLIAVLLSACRWAHLDRLRHHRHNLRTEVQAELDRLVLPVLECDHPPCCATASRPYP